MCKLNRVEEIDKLIQRTKQARFDFHTKHTFPIIDYFNLIVELNEIVDKMKKLEIPLSYESWEFDDSCIATCWIEKKSIVTRKRMKKLLDGAIDYSLQSYDISDYFCKNQYKHIIDVKENHEPITEDGDYSIDDISPELLIKILEYQKKELQAES